MSKGKSGKKAPVMVGAPESTVSEAPSANAVDATDQTSKPSGRKDQVNICVKDTPKLLREHTKDDGSSFYSVTVPVAGFNGAPADKVDFVSFTATPKQVSQAMRPVYDKAEDGTKTLKRDDNGKVVKEPIDGYKNIWLYGSDHNVKVNYATDERTEDGKRVYASATIKAGDLRDMNESARKQYRSAKNNEKATSQTVDRAAAAEAVVPASTPAETAIDDQIDID